MQIDQTSAQPTRKVTAGVLAGAVATILVFGFRTLAGVEVPGEVTVALTTLLIFGVQYQTRENL